MGKLSFYTHYKRPGEDFEQLSDELVVERAGYVDTKTQIENFIRSGQLLMASRRSMYDDVGDDDDDSPLPPDRYINDPVDIAEQERINAAYRQAKAEADQAKADQAKADQAKADQDRISVSEPADTHVSDKVVTVPTEKIENSN